MNIPPPWPLPVMAIDFRNANNAIAVAGVPMSASPLFYNADPALASSSMSPAPPLPPHPYHLNPSLDHRGVPVGGGPARTQLRIVPNVAPSLYNPTIMDMANVRPTRLIGVPQLFGQSLLEGNVRLSAGKELPAYCAYYSGDVSGMYEPVTNNSVLSAKTPGSSSGPDPHASSNMPGTGTGNVDMGGSRVAAPEMTTEYDVRETNGGSTSLWMFQLNFQHANTSFKKYKAKVDKLRHITESKDKMLGALCVRRNQLISEVVRATQMVRASRQRLEGQRKANKALMKHIEHLVAMDYASRDEAMGGTDGNPGRPSAVVDSSGNRNNSSHEISCSDGGSPCIADDVSYGEGGEENADYTAGLLKDDGTSERFCDAGGSLCCLENGTELCFLSEEEDNGKLGQP